MYPSLPSLVMLFLTFRQLFDIQVSVQSSAARRVLLGSISLPLQIILICFHRAYYCLMLWYAFICVLFSIKMELLGEKVFLIYCYVYYAKNSDWRRVSTQLKSCWVSEWIGTLSDTDGRRASSKRRKCVFRLPQQGSGPQLSHL